jgi:hypothetical protein
MHIEYGSEEARLLRQLLADAHQQIRGLQAQVDQLAAALLLLTLNDRRRATGSHAEGGGGRERRRESVAMMRPDRDRRGRGRQSATQSE